MNTARMRLVGVALVAALTPGLLAYAALLIKARTSLSAWLASGSYGNTPNPAPSSGFPDPAYVLVYFDPSWSGWLSIWAASALAAIGALVWIAAVWWPRDPSPRSLLALRLLSLGVGAALAWPWIRVLCS
jgi:hypothetical protein